LTAWKRAPANGLSRRFAIFARRGGADALNFSARQRRLQDIGCVQRTFAEPAPTSVCSSSIKMMEFCDSISSFMMELESVVQISAASTQTIGADGEPGLARRIVEGLAIVRDGSVVPGDTYSRPRSVVIVAEPVSRQFESAQARIMKS